MEMDTDYLAMENQETLDTCTCPKCNIVYHPGCKECPNCGVIFEKVKSFDAEKSDDAPESGDPSAIQGHLTESGKSKKIIKFSIWLLIIGIFLFGCNYIYLTHFESRRDAKNFQAKLHEFCTFKIAKKNADSMSREEEPYLTGKVIAVSPAHNVTNLIAGTDRTVTLPFPEQIHPVWYKLSRKFRARHPDEVDSLIRVYKELGKTGRYGKLKTKVYNTHKIILDVFDWRNKTYIGTKIFDPGDPGIFMTDEDYDAMMKSVSAETIAEYIESMDIYKE